MSLEMIKVEAPLPSYSDEHLAQLDADALIDVLVAGEDRVPRNIVEAAARLGDPMMSALGARLGDRWDGSVNLGDWWLRLHAVMILGVMDREGAGLMLVELMRRMAVAEDDSLQDWLAGDWPALFANKPPRVLASLRELCLDRRLDWYIRCNALEAVLADAERQGSTSLESTLAWVAQMAADEDEDWDMRLWYANGLLDFPREAYRSLLERLAAQQVGPTAVFTADDVSRAYGADRARPWRRRDDNPWRFYSPESIRHRQERWAREDADADDAKVDPDDIAVAPATSPYTRNLPKIGRNDPCPCGSGRKFKKCCLPKLQG
jgi:hypothetical protein